MDQSFWGKVQQGILSFHDPATILQPKVNPLKAFNK
jgi:hypothetical protein